MKIATYNVHNLFDPGTCVDDSAEPISQAFFEKRIAYFIDFFKKLDLDIICLQEIGGEEALKRITSVLPYTYFCAKPNKRGIRMAVLYKNTLKESIFCESVSFGALPIPSIEVQGDTSMLKPIEQRRDILELTLTLKDTSISINTFHLKSNLPQYLEGDDMEHDSDAYVDAKVRCVFYKIMELRALRKHATKRQKEGKEVVLLGDYNENNIASTIDILKGSQEEDLRLTDVLAGYEGDKTTHMHRGQKLTFDTMLISQGLVNKITQVRVENDTLEDCSQLPLEAEVVESDHALVWAEIAE